MNDALLQISLLKMGNHSSIERMDVAGRAHARYPNDSLEVAISFYMSDKRNAGYGALWQRQRKYWHQDEVRNSKDMYDMGEGIQYTCRVNLPKQYTFPKFDFSLPMATGPIIGNGCFTQTELPARNKCLAIRFDKRDFDTPSRRKYVADKLRELRRQMRLP